MPRLKEFDVQQLCGIKKDQAKGVVSDDGTTGKRQKRDED